MPKSRRFNNNTMLLEEVANRTIFEHEIIQLSVRDQHLFTQTLLNPPKPNAKLLKAALLCDS